MPDLGRCTSLPHPPAPLGPSSHCSSSSASPAADMLGMCWRHHTDPVVRVGYVVFSLTPWATREARPRPPACSRHLHCEKEPGLGVLPPCPLPPTGPGAHAGARHRATATGPGIAPFSMEPGQKLPVPTWFCPSPRSPLLLALSRLGLKCR